MANVADEKGMSCNRNCRALVKQFGFRELHCNCEKDMVLQHSRRIILHLAPLTTSKEMQKNLLVVVGARFSQTTWNWDPVGEKRELDTYHSVFYRIQTLFTRFANV